MLNTSFSPWPSFSDAEAEAVKSVLLSNRVNYWTGELTREFEKRFAAWTGAQFGVGLANGTVALDACWKALGIRTGDEIIVTPRTFFASASSIVNAGAKPVFADIDRDSQNITPETVAPHITSKTKAILCVHLAGWPCDMDGLADLVAGRGIALVEDCAQAHGAKLRGRMVGSLGEIAAWSFCQDKIMTTGGEGGMITTSRPDLWKSSWAEKDHGKSWDAVYERTHPPGFRWLHEHFGNNWRMLEMQAVIGLIQLESITAWTEQRRRNSHKIFEAASEMDVLRVPSIPNSVEHGYYKAYVQVRPDALAPDWTRDRIMAEINAMKVPCYSGSCSEIYLEKAFDNTDMRPEHRLPNAKELGETSLMFLVHPTLTEDEIDRTCEAIRITMGRAKK